MKAIYSEPLPIKSILQLYEFVIPEFQRPYSWDEEKCAQLWEDLESFLVGGDDKYFLGNIVVYPAGDNDGKSWSVIDGQQRLTTLLLLLKAMFNRAGTMDVLGQMIYKLDPITGNPPKEGKEPCIKSEVQPGDGRDDCADLRKIIAGDLAGMGKKNPFKANYKYLEDAFNKWCDSTQEQLHSNLLRFLDRVTMLFIRCDSEEDALTLFQTINDRGMPLGDADIFKAKIYREASAAGAQGDFIARWKGMKEHEDLFRIFMHISRAKNKDITKEIALRKYMESKHLGANCGLAGEWESIVGDLELCHGVSTADSTVSDKQVAAQENIYWQILAQYPNVYGEYPLYVYLHKHAEEWNKGEFYISPERNGEYVALMRNTVRYFFIKGLVHNAVNAVRDTAYRVCAAIAHGRDYVAEYKKNIDAHGDCENLERRLSAPLGRYRNGLIVLAASLHSDQDLPEFADFLERGYDIEHILPRSWRNYGGWDEKSHGAHIGAIGNLVPLEKAINRGAGNEWFPYKQGKYAKSKVQDAKDLCNLSHWHPEDVKKRQEESVARLLKFLKEFE